MFTTYRTGNVVFSLIASNIFCAAAELSNVSTTRTASGPITKPVFEPAKSGLAADLSIAAQAPDPRSRNEKGVGLWHAALKHIAAHIAYATGTMEFFIEVTSGVRIEPSPNDLLSSSSPNLKRLLYILVGTGIRGKKTKVAESGRRRIRLAIHRHPIKCGVKADT